MDRIIVEANTLEAVNKQMEDFGSTASSAHGINKVEIKPGTRFKNDRLNSSACTRCGNRRHMANDPKCPARDKDCLKCGLRGHFRQFCRTRQPRKRTTEERNDNTRNNKQKKTNDRKNEINQVEERQDTENTGLTTHYVFHIDDDVDIDCSIGGIKTKMLVDSGCKQNLITAKTWEMLKANKIVVSNQIPNPGVSFVAYGSSTPLEVKGSFETRIEVGDKSTTAKFFVITNGTKNLLGKITAMSLGILKIGLNLEVHQVESNKFPKFKEVLIELPIDKTVPAISQPYRYSLK